jgi:Protein of unknown function (DUF4236)
MPFRFYRRFRAGPFRMNVSKGGLSASVGQRAFQFIVSQRVKLARRSDFAALDALAAEHASL